MHDLTGKREAVIRVLEETIRLLEEDTGGVREAGVSALGLASARFWQPRRDEIVERLQIAFDWDFREGELAAAAAFVPDLISKIRAHGVTDTAWYLPRHRTMALFQSAMEEYLDQRDQVVPGEFKVSDPLWIGIVLRKIRAFFRGKARFPRHESKSDLRFRLGDSARIALVANWATGSRQAQAVARQIERRKPDHIIHLGGTYYSGDDREVRTRMLGHWPKPETPHRSWALNSDRDMYSGGFGYFKTLLREFGQPASYFNLGNDYWRLIGLDTGYVGRDLNIEQADWLAEQLKGPEKKVILTHHPLFSAFEQPSSKLERWLEPVVSSGWITAWFWGFEQRCVVYDEYNGIKGRCIGHGSLPYLAPAAKGERETPPIDFAHTRTRRDAGNLGVNGFALLTLDRKDLKVEYVDEDGEVAYTEDL
jgi:hypothetical protein